MRMDILQGIALFVICLVVSIPAVHAQLISTYSVDSKGVHNYRAQSDKTTIIAEIKESGVASVDVRYMTQKDVPFDSCTSSLGKTICKYEFPVGVWKPGIWSYYVNYKGEGVSGYTVVDNLAPNATFSLVTGKNLTVFYTTSDRAYEGNNDYCSNVNRVNFLLGGSVIKSLNLNLTPGVSCSGSQFIQELSPPSTNGMSKSFCLELIDNVGNRGMTCKYVIIDREAPEVSNLEIQSQSDRIRLDFVPANIIDVNLVFTVKETNLSSLFVDASDFNSNNAYGNYGYENLEVSADDCTPNYHACKGNCKCEVPIKLSIPDGGTPVLRITATDTSENKANLQLPLTVHVDADSPVVASLNAESYELCGSRNVIGTGLTSIVATINEAGSGLNRNMIFLDLNTVLSAPNADFGNLYPNSCSRTGSQWLCLWGPFISNTNLQNNQAVTLKIHDSSDDVGNGFGYSADFIYDNEGPVFSGYSIRGAVKTPGESFGEEITRYPVAGGTLTLEVRANDTSAVSATADFRNVAAVGFKTVSCSGTTQEKTCKFEYIGPLGGASTESLAIPVNLTDCAGNVRSIIARTNISLIEELRGTYWNYGVTAGPSPAEVDRQTMTVFSHKVYFSVGLGAYVGGAVPIVQSIDSCWGKTADGSDVTSYIEANSKNKRVPYLIGAPSTNPIVRFTMQRTSPPDSLTFTCKFKTITQSGIYISQPEYDNLTFTLKFKNSGLGTIDQALKDKVNKIKNSPLVKGKIIGTLNGILNILTNTCAMWTTLHTIGTSIDAILVFLGIWKETAVTPPDKAAATTTSEVHKAATNSYMATLASLDKKIGYWCGFISCTWTFNPVVKKFIESVQSGLIFNQKEGGWSLQKALGFTNPNDPNKFTPITDPRDSLIISTAELCIPGIIMNLQKARQIECSYIYCIRTQVAGGVPPIFCDYLRASSWCKYVFGEVFQLIPWVQFVEYLLDFAKKALTDPMMQISLALEACIWKFEPKEVGLCGFAVNTLATAKGLLSLFDANKWKTFFKPTTDICSSDVVQKQ